MKKLDVVTLGRCSVDLYGEQVGGRLEEMSSFAKYVGGCPANIAIGTSRLGLESAIISRVGDDAMGQYIREEMQREGVEVSSLHTDPERLTALVLLGIRHPDSFPLIFYRENCADMALEQGDVSPEMIASSQALVVTGTHFSTPGVAAVSRRAMELAQEKGSKIALDIDYRPVLWGLTGKGEGEERYIRADSVTEHLQSILPACDLVVGTEEEIHIAGGSEDTVEALHQIRKKTKALIVCKRGAEGCSLFPDAIATTLDEAITVPGFPIEVFNVLGAGDAFMSGFLRGWLRGESLETAARWANACGALVVSRHGCAPAIPTWEELEAFLKEGSAQKALRFDRKLNALHRATTRERSWGDLCILAIDHRVFFEELARENDRSAEDIVAFKQCAVEAFCNYAGTEEGCGILLDSQYAAEGLYGLADSPHWVGRPVEKAGVTPLEFAGGREAATILREWPRHQVVKVLVFVDGAQDPVQVDRLLALQEACWATHHEYVLEVVVRESSERYRVDPSALLESYYRQGIAPDWWKLESPGSSEQWDAIARMIRRSDSHCRGVLVLGKGASSADLKERIALAAKQSICRGFAIGRTIFAQSAQQWFRGEVSRGEVVKSIGRNWSDWRVLWRQNRMHQSENKS